MRYGTREWTPNIYSRCTWALVVLMAGCGPREGVDPTINIVAPKDGEVVQGSSLTVRIAVENSPQLTSGASDCQTAGTWNPLGWFVGDAYAAIPPASLVEVQLDGEHALFLDSCASVGNGFLVTEIGEITPGPHVLMAEALNGNQQPFEPRVLDSVEFRVEP